METKKLIHIFYLLVWILLLSGCNDDDKILQGYVEGDYTYLSPAISGKLEKLFVARGSQLNAGQIIFTLDQQPEAAQLLEAQHKLAQAQQTLLDLQKGQRQTIIDQLEAQKAQIIASLKFDKITYERYLKLYKQGAIDKSSLDNAYTAYQLDVKKIKEQDADLAEAKQGSRENQILAQQAVVKSSLAAIAQSQWALSQKTVYAPVSGQVFDTYFRVGEYVPASQAVVSMLAPENIKLIFYISETMLSKIKIGAIVKFGCDSCNRTYQAPITFISSSAEYTPPVIYSESSRDKLVYRIEAIIPKQEVALLHAGQPVDIYIQ